LWKYFQEWEAKAAKAKVDYEEAMKEYNANGGGGGGGTAASGGSSKPSSKASAAKNISPTKVR
jgi:hypothetical protein